VEVQNTSDRTYRQVGVGVLVGVSHHPPLPLLFMNKKQYEHYKEFAEQHRAHFNNSKVIEVGSLDVNGNIKDLFHDCDHIGIDVVTGKNVDVVSVAHQYNPDGQVDVIYSTNSLEHDRYWKSTLIWMFRWLKTDGLFFLTCSYSHAEHGTRNTSPHKSGTGQIAGWDKWYKNFTTKDITRNINLEKHLKTHDIRIVGRDLRMWGIKK